MHPPVDENIAEIVPQPAPSSLMNTVVRFAVNHVAPHMQNRIQASRTPFAEPDIMLPHHDSRWWGWTHYGIFIPSLPEPYRFLNTMTFIGATGTACFDNDYLAAKDARNTATVLSATAFGEDYHYRAYDASSGCNFRSDGSRLAWGDDLVIACRYPEYTVTAQYHHMNVDLAVHATDQVSYFTKTSIYSHFSVLATYKGTIKDIRGTTPIAGMCTVEYGRCMTPQALMQRPLPAPLKLSVTFFTYHIVQLDERSQLLLTKVSGAGCTLCLLAHLRTLDSVTARVFERTSLEIVSYAEDPAVDIRGRKMRVPKKMRWIVDQDAGENLLSLEAEVDAPFRYGLGRGYSSAYTFNCTWGSRLVSGTGYFEWIDVE